MEKGVAARHGARRLGSRVVAVSLVAALVSSGVVGSLAGLVPIAGHSVGSLAGPVPAAGHSVGYRVAAAGRGEAAPPPVWEPTRDRQPGAAFLGACQEVTSAVAAQRRCEQAALPAFDAARASEGIGPLVLPAGFATEPASVQLLVLIDLERVARGLPAVPSLSPYLDFLAEWGATHGSDPPLPPGRSGGSNWAGGLRSTLLTTFLWMYDDGPGSPNIECPSAGAPGCWGHRRNILSAYPAPALMGAYSKGGSLAMLVAAGGGLSRTGPTWGSLAALVPVALSASSLTADASSGEVVGVHLSLWGTAAATIARLGIVGGRGEWHLEHDSCVVVPGGDCSIWVAYRPSGPSPSSAELIVEAAGGRRVVSLHGGG